MIQIQEFKVNSGYKPAAVFVVGGAAGNIGRILFENGIDVDVVAVNTDREALDKLSSSVDFIIPVAEGSTRGNVALATQYAREKECELRARISAYGHITIVAALGGGAGTGISPVVAECCNAEGVPFDVCAIMPFGFEGKELAALEGFRTLRSLCRNKDDATSFANDDAIETFGAHSFPEAIESINRLVADEIKASLADVPHDPRRRQSPQDSDDQFTVAGARVSAI